MPVYDLLNCGPRQRFMILSQEGPVIAHNCTQATCRDLLVAALHRLEAAGYPVALHVHDSATVEALPGSASEVARLMCETPPWAAGFPLAVDAHESERFSK